MATPSVDHPFEEDGVSSPSHGYSPVEGDVTARVMAGAENGAFTCRRRVRTVCRPVTLADYM